MRRPAVFKSTAVDGKMWTVTVEGVDTHYRTRDEARTVAGLKPARRAGADPIKVTAGHWGENPDIDRMFGEDTK